MKGILKVSLYLIFVGTAAAQSADNRLVGRWYGFLDSPGEAHCWISERSADGTYRTDFITQDGREFKSYHQQGSWFASGQSFTTIVESESGTPVPADRIQYTIVRVTPRVLVYRHEESGTEFTVTRVDTGFRLRAKCGKTDA